MQPIKDYELLDEMFEVAGEHDERYAGTKCVSWELILLLGFNTSFRVSDFSRLRVKDLLDIDHYTIRAKKTGKEGYVFCREDTKRELKRLLTGRNPEEYALAGRSLRGRAQRPVTRQRVYQILNEIAREAGYKGRIGCHTLRKTFGYEFYKRSGNDVAELMDIFGHSSQKITLRYIGIKTENQDKIIQKMYPFRRKRGRRGSRGKNTEE